MGLFNNRNANEDAYVGGKKHWVDVIKDSGPEDLLIWRQPEEDFNTNSTLVVMPGEEALFVKGGTIEQVFTNGTYKLTTQNYPFISRLRNAFSGGVSAFNCVVYFVRTAPSKEINWGTQSPIQYFDETYQELRIKGYGAYKVNVSNSSLLLTKLIGANVDLASTDDLNQYFANQFHQHISDAISNAIDRLKAQTGKAVFALASGHRTEMASIIEALLAPIVEDYGLLMEAFSLAHLKIEAADPEMEKVIRQRMAMDVMQGAQVNPAWQAQQQVDIMKNLSNNPGGGGLASAGMGVGMGIGAMGMMGGMMGNMQAMQPQPQPTPQTDDPMAKLQKLKQMLDMGLISTEDFEAKKKEILNTL
ncbi:MAG: SPFH domain-containing protein [Bacteroidales bacterium]|nr:SPFH domain-containing protein [Bacteroidales bacterium]